MVNHKKRHVLRNIFVLVISIALLLSFSPFLVHAHGDELDHGDKEPLETLEDRLKSMSLILVIIALVIVLLLVIISFLFKENIQDNKKFIFLGIVIPVVIATLFLAGSTIYLNLISETKGPVHWHADYEIYICGEKIDIKDPEGLSNKVGSSVFHEHNDDRIHVEGVVIDKSEVDLHSFFGILGGQLTNDHLTLPTTDGVVAVTNGDLCDGKQSVLQVFVYKVINPDPNKKTGFTYVQEKRDNFENYVLSPYANVPPGDCIIIEFDEEKETTSHICETYGLAIGKGDLVGS